MSEASTSAWQPSPADLLATVDRMLAERPRWVGGSMPGIQVEACRDMPPGWFGLREPLCPAPYAGPLPLASFGVFYRGGDIVRLSQADMDALADRTAAPHGRERGSDG